MEKFASELITLLREKGGDEYNVVILEVVCTNDTKRHTVNLFKKNQRFSKSFCIEDYYKLYQNGETIEEISDQIMSLVKTTEEEMGMLEVISAIEEKPYCRVKEKVVAKLLNLGLNEAYLKGKCYMPYLDLAVCFFFVIENNDDNFRLFPVQKKVFEQWKISKEQLFKDAVENMKSIFPAEILKMGDLLNEIEKEMGIELSECKDISIDESLYILTNVRRINGATAILYDGILKDFATEHDVDEVIIIPSSVHEVILLPKQLKAVLSEKEAENIVRTVNRDYLLSDDILSNHVYVYSRQNNQIKSSES